MEDNIQQFIDSLILAIENAEDPESVTNGMVARVLGYLNSCHKSLSDNNLVICNSLDILKNQLNGKYDASEARQLAHDVLVLQNSFSILENSINEITGRRAGFPPFIKVAIAVQDSIADTSYTGGDYVVVFDLVSGLFLASPSESGLSGQYYKNWATATQYMDETRTRPLPGRLWKGPGGQLHYWDGEALVQVCGTNGHGQDTEARREIGLLSNRLEILEKHPCVDEERVKQLINEFEVSSSGPGSGSCGCAAISFDEIDALFDQKTDLNPDLPEDAERIEEADIDKLIAAPAPGECTHEPYTGEGISISELEDLIENRRSE